MEIIDYEEKEMIPLTYEENNSYKEQEACHLCEEKFCMDKDDKNYKNKRKVKDHCHYTGKFRGAAHSKCNLNYKVPKDIPIIIHNASYDTHFIINQLAEELKSKLKGGLLTVLDLCRLHYQNFLITCLEFLIV